MTDASGNTTYQYDLRGRLVAEGRTFIGDNTTYVTRFGYDSADRNTWILYPTGENVTQTYNGRGLPDTLSGSVVGNLVTGSLYNRSACQHASAWATASIPPSATMDSAERMIPAEAITAGCGNSRLKTQHSIPCRTSSTRGMQAVTCLIATTC